MIDKQFFRLNRQYLISFRAEKEVERYFARKLLVNLVVPAREQLLVSKEKLSSFLHWLDNR
jgi:two-component system response regulator LytT